MRITGGRSVRLLRLSMLREGGSCTFEHFYRYFLCFWGVVLGGGVEG